jgi:hypothetical protein
MSSKTYVRSTEEIRRIGIEALAEALGPLDAVRFLQSFDLGRGDYTKERSHVCDLGIDEIFQGIERMKKEKTGAAKYDR